MSRVHIHLLEISVGKGIMKVVWGGYEGGWEGQKVGRMSKLCVCLLELTLGDRLGIGDSEG